MKKTKNKAKNNTKYLFAESMFIYKNVWFNSMKFFLYNWNRIEIDLYLNYICGSKSTL